MKRLYPLILCVSPLITTTSFSQVYVYGILIYTRNTPYCQLIGANAGVFSEAHITIDYGQRCINTGLNRQQVSDPNRQPIVFNSTIDALNFMVR